VQLYFHDPVAQVTRPTTQLLGFTRVDLDAGQTASVTFDIHTDRLAFTGIDMRRIAEPGRIDLLVGSSSTDIRLRTAVSLTGAHRVVREPRTLLTSVAVEYPH
jgi:hypothetical protein